MGVDGLSEVVPPSGRVPGQRLLAAPILKRWRQRNKEGIGKKGSGAEGFRTRGKYRRKGAARGPKGSPGAPWAWPHSSEALVGPLWPPLDVSGSFRCADFLYDFPRIYWAL